MKKILLALLLLTNTATAQVVTNEELLQGTEGWVINIQGSGIATVDDYNPRYGFGDVGEQSLYLSTAGNMEDWVFVVNQTNTPWGNLSQLTELSFDWFRIPNDNWDAESVNDIPLYDWKVKSPAFRVMLGDGSEIVWEHYFNTNANDVSYINSWQVQNILADDFWYRDGDGYSLLTTPCNTGYLPIWGGHVAAVDINGIVNCYGDKSIVGVAVGLGNQWPYAYEGFVDNVILGIDGQQVLNTNFDRYVDVPEPATAYLIMSGILLLLFLKKCIRTSSQVVEGTGLQNPRR